MLGGYVGNIRFAQGARSVRSAQEYPPEDDRIGLGDWKIADWVNWPVRRQWLQKRCQSEIDIAKVVQLTSGCLLLPWQ